MHSDFLANNFELNGFKYCYQTLIILFDINYLIAHGYSISSIAISAQLALSHYLLVRLS